ncbi:hypothetical protein L596_008426 [Steinernema carpocapsae]|uniref:Uncharacterized protein n=1 Tax=Steinernema carpocapsae TaxID=34508 RepID=A0A4U5PCJ4_STECR|nr:hypothetical protein L596_008426 [Steinernema carpocapsae]
MPPHCLGNSGVTDQTPLIFGSGRVDRVVPPKEKSIESDRSAVVTRMMQERHRTPDDFFRMEKTKASVHHKGQQYRKV